MLKVDELLSAIKGRLICGRRSGSIEGISIDSRTIKKNEAFIAIKGSNFDGHDFIDEAVKKGAMCIVAEPRPQNNQALTRNKKGLALIEVKDTTKALGDIARFKRREFGIPVIAVCGSNGKTTTKEMVAWTLSKNFNILKNDGTKNNHIGIPLTLLNLNSGHDAAVLELGTNHFGEIDYLAKICQPNIGIITNIGPAHLEHFGSLEGVLKEKYRLIENLDKPCIGLLSADDGLLRKHVAQRSNLSRTQGLSEAGALTKTGRGPFIFSFGIQKRSDIHAFDIKRLGGKTEFRVNLKYKFTLNTLGYYNIYNALAAVAVARIFGMEYEDISSQLAAFDFPQGRLKLIELNNIRFIDDTYNSNPVSLRHALDALDNFRTRGRRIFVMGDMLELGAYAGPFHYKAGRQAAEVCDVFITVGELSKLAARSAEDTRLSRKNIFICESAQEARDILFNRLSLRRDDVVLVKGSRAMKMEGIFRA